MLDPVAALAAAFCVRLRRWLCGHLAAGCEETHFQQGLELWTLLRGVKGLPGDAALCALAACAMTVLKHGNRVEAAGDGDTVLMQALMHEVGVLAMQLREHIAAVAKSCDAEGSTDWVKTAKALVESTEMRIKGFARDRLANEFVGLRTAKLAAEEQARGMRRGSPWYKGHRRRGRGLLGEVARPRPGRACEFGHPGQGVDAALASMKGKLTDVRAAMAATGSGGERLRPELREAEEAYVGVSVLLRRMSLMWVLSGDSSHTVTQRRVIEEIRHLRSLCLREKEHLPEAFFFSRLRGARDSVTTARHASQRSADVTHGSGHMCRAFRI